MLMITENIVWHGQCIVGPYGVAVKSGILSAETAPPGQGALLVWKDGRKEQ